MCTTPPQKKTTKSSVKSKRYLLSFTKADHKLMEKVIELSGRFINSIFTWWRDLTEAQPTQDTP